MKGTETPEKVCETTVASCRCRLPVGHRGLHECSDLVHCDGSWGLDASGEFVIGRLPRPFRECPLPERARSTVLGLLSVLSSLG